MEKHRSFHSLIKASWKDFKKEQIGTHGYYVFLKATAGKWLWILFVTKVAAIYTTHTFLSHLPGAPLVIALGGITLISTAWDQVFKNRMPDFVQNTLNGDIAYQLDSNALNWYLLSVASLDTAIISGPALLREFKGFAKDKL